MKKRIYVDEKLLSNPLRGASNNALLGLIKPPAMRVVMTLSVVTKMRKLEPSLRELRKFPDAEQCANWGDERNRIAYHVGAELQGVAFLCEKGLIDSEYIIDGFGKDFAESWNKLYLYIRRYRTSLPNEKMTIKEGAEFLKHFESFAIKCAKHFHIQTPP